MFSIDNRNKIKLTLGDTASLYLQVYDKAGNQREPEEGDVVTFSIDSTEYSVEASQTNDGRYLFNLLVEDIDSGVYTYRIVLVNGQSRYTIFEDEFIELLGDGEEPTPEPEPEPEPTGDPFVIEFNNPTGNIGEYIVVQMRVYALDGSNVVDNESIDIRYDPEYLEVVSCTGFNNANITYGTGTIGIGDWFITPPAPLVTCNLIFTALQAGTTTIDIPYTKGFNGNNMEPEHIGSSTITIGGNL